MTFTNELLNAVGAWQKGWREEQSLREQLAEELRRAVSTLPSQFRQETVPCYRKRFLHKGEFADLFLRDERHEGLVSWTTNRQFAECFKGFYRSEAVTGAIFRHEPKPNEVVVNIPALWASPTFVLAAKSYRERGGQNSEALFNFADSQGEVVLETALRGSEIVALTGASSSFDELCEFAGIPESERDQLSRDLAAQGVYPGEHCLITDEAVQRVIFGTVRKICVLLCPSPDLVDTPKG